MGTLIARLADWAETVFLFPFFGAVTTVMGVLAGYLGAHYEHDIAEATAPFFLPGSTISPGASVFWLSTLLFGASFGGTFWAQARSTARATRELKDATAAVDGHTEDLAAKTQRLGDAASSIDAQTRELATQTKTIDGLVRDLFTVPPKGFLVEYRTAIELSQLAFLQSEENGAVLDELRIAIRTQLVCIIKLAAAFDADGARARYGSNVMVYRPRDTIGPAEADAIDARLKFAERNVGVGKLAGVLDLIRELSAASDSGTERDGMLDALALAIPRLTEKERLELVESSGGGILPPGASEAYVTDKEVVVEDLPDFLRRVSSDHFTLNLRTEMERYFRERPAICSFVSIPLYNHSAEPEGASRRCVGILNIHRNLPNPGLARKFELLSPMLTPVAVLLGHMVSTYVTLDATLAGH